MSEKNYSVKRAFRLLWNDIRGAWVGIAAAAAVLAMSRFFFHTVCPTVMVTGFPCPACGLTRAFRALAAGHFAEAFSIHPFIYPIAGMVLFLLVWRYYFQKSLRPFVKYMILLIVAMVIYYVYRMIRYFPGEPPISYYYDSILGRILSHIHMLRR